MGIIVELEELSFMQILKLAWSASRVLYGCYWVTSMQLMFT